MRDRSYLLLARLLIKKLSMLLWYGTKVGACIVDAGHKIVGIGHNKLPDGVDEKAFKFWKNDIKEHGFMNTKYPYGECQLSQNINHDARSNIFFILLCLQCAMLQFMQF
jgi:deoxycytidylate deaminase